MFIASYYGLSYPIKTNFGETIGYYNTILITFQIYVFYPFAMIYCIAVNEKKLNNPTFKQRWGILWASSNTTTRL
jgi:hypothetical protein